MIAFLRGRLINTGPDFVIIDVNGIGYKVFVPIPVIGVMTDKNSEVTIYTYLHVREDAMLLFGFLQESDQEIFELLIQISGIGPKVALAVLSSMSAPSFIHAVINEQVGILTQIPGVGKKTAQRVIIELKDKLEKYIKCGMEIRDVSFGLPDTFADAVHALIVLGYSSLEAKKILGRISANHTDQIKTEDLVRIALKELGRF